MINTILTTYGKLLEQYLSSFFHQPEGIVEVGTLLQNEEESNKLIISLFNIEREAAHGISNSVVRRGGGVYSSSNPYIHANLFIILAAVYRSKRYRESLSVLSQAISFLQSTPVFDAAGGNRYTIEPVTLSWQDQSNIWSAFGGKYYPSVFCKIRGVVFDADEMKQILPELKDTDLSLNDINRPL